MLEAVVEAMSKLGRDKRCWSLGASVCLLGIGGSMRASTMLIVFMVMIGVFLCGVWAGGKAVDAQRDAEMDAAAKTVVHANEMCLTHWSL